MKHLLIVTAFLEGTTGLALLAAPSSVTEYLLGTSLTDPVGFIMSKVAGSALFSIAIACWLSRKCVNSTTLKITLLYYNLTSVVILGYAGLHENLNGIVLFPAIVTHVVMAFWIVKYVHFFSPFKTSNHENNREKSSS